MNLSAIRAGGRYAVARIRRRGNALAFALLLGTALGAELWLRANLPTDAPFREERVARPYILFAGRPGSEGRSAAQMGEVSEADLRYAIGPDGFREPEAVPIEKPAGEVRVFVLGGSSVFNGSPNAASIPGRLQERFRRAGDSHVRVFNWGFPSYCSGQELALLLHEVIDRDPDLVVVYGGGNDLHQPHFYDPRPGYPATFYSFEAGLRTLSTPHPRQTAAALLHSSLLLRRLGGSVLAGEIIERDRLLRDVGAQTPPWEEKIRELYLGNLRSMAGLAEAFEFDLAVVLQPLVFFNRQRTDRIRNTQSTHPADVPFREYMIRQYGAIRTDFARLAAHPPGPRSRFLDYSLVLENASEDIFWDFIHIRNEGNRFVADRLYEDLRRSDARAGGET